MLLNAVSSFAVTSLTTFIAVAATLILLLSSSHSSPAAVMAFPVPQALVNNYSSTFLEPNETICGSAYGGDNIAYFGIEVGFNTTYFNPVGPRGVVIEVDLTTMTRLQTYRDFGTGCINPCTLMVSNDGTMLYVATNSQPAETHFISRNGNSTHPGIGLAQVYLDRETNTNRDRIISGAVAARTEEYSTNYVFFGSSGDAGTTPTLIKYTNASGTITKQTTLQNNDMMNIKSMFVLGQFLYIFTDLDSGRRHRIRKYYITSLSLVQSYSYTCCSYYAAAAWTDGIYGFFSLSGGGQTLRMKLDGLPTPQIDYDGRGSTLCAASRYQMGGSMTATNGKVGFLGSDYYTDTNCGTGIMTMSGSRTMNIVSELHFPLDGNRHFRSVFFNPDDGKAYYSFQDSELTSFVLTSPQSLTPTLAPTGVMHISGYAFGLPGGAALRRERWTDARARCMGATMMGGQAGYLATVKSKDRETAIVSGNAVSEWSRAWLGGNRSQWSSYFSWTEGPMPVSNFYLQGSGCQGLNYCNVQNDQNIQFGNALSLMGRTGQLQLEDAVANESAVALCEWSAPDVKATTADAAVLAAPRNRFYEVNRIARTSPESRSTCAPAISDSNVRYEFDKFDRRIRIYPYLHSAEQTDWIEWNVGGGCDTNVNAMATVASKLLFVACGSGGKLYQVDLATKVRTELNDYGSFRVNGLREIRAGGASSRPLVVVLGNSQTDIFSVDKITGARTLVWTYGRFCHSVTLRQSKGAPNGQLLAMCSATSGGNNIDMLHYNFFQNPNTGRLTTYDPTPSVSNFAAPTLSGVAAGTGAFVGATVITTAGAASGLGEIPLAFDVAATYTTDTCRYLCRSMFVDTTTCSTSLVTLASGNVTAARILNYRPGTDPWPWGHIDLVLTNRAALLTCTGGSVYTPSARTFNLPTTLLLRAATEAGDPTGQRPRANNYWSYYVRQAVMWPSRARAADMMNKADDELFGVAAEVRGDRCIKSNQPEQWWSRDLLYPDFNFERSSDPLNTETDTECKISVIFYYNATSGLIVWQQSFAGEFSQMPVTVGEEFIGGAQSIASKQGHRPDFADAILSSHVSLIKAAAATTLPYVFLDMQTSYFNSADETKLYFIQPSGLVNMSASASTFTVATELNVYTLRAPEVGVPGVVDEYAVMLDSKDFAEDMHVLRCGVPTSGKLFFTTSKAGKVYGTMGTGDMPAINNTMWEPSLGSGAFFDATTNRFALINIPCPAGDKPTRVDLVITFTADAAQPLRIPFVILPANAPVPTDGYPFLPATTAPATMLTPKPQYTDAAIVTLPEYAPSAGSGAAITGFDSATSLAAASTALAAATGSSFVVEYKIKSPALGMLQLNHSALGVNSGGSVSSDGSTLTVWGSSATALAAALSAGIAALHPNLDNAQMQLLAKRYLQISVTNTPGGLSRLTLPLTTLTVNTGPMVNANAGCPNIRVPEGTSAQLRFNFTFGDPLFWHPQNMLLNISWRTLPGEPMVPNTMFIKCYPTARTMAAVTSGNNTCNAQGTIPTAYSPMLRIEFNATDGYLWKSTICNVKPYFVPLTLVRPVTAAIRVKAQTEFRYVIPMDMFISSAPVIKYNRVLSALITSGDVHFDTPNVLRGAFPNLGTYSFVIEAEDSFRLATAVVSFVVSDATPIVSTNGVLPIAPVRALRPFNITLPVPCHDPDGDPLTVTMVTPPPSWVTWQFSPGNGVATRRDQQLFLNGVPPVSAVSASGLASSAFTVRCADNFYSVTYQQSISVLPNGAPSLIKPLPNMTVVQGAEAEQMIDAWQYFTDPDGDRFSIQVSVPAAIRTWVTATVLTPPSHDQSINALNNQRIHIKLTPEKDGPIKDATNFVMFVYAVDALGAQSTPMSPIAIQVRWSNWRKCMEDGGPCPGLFGGAGALVALVFLVCCYAQLCNHFCKRSCCEGAVIQCPLTRESPTWEFPAETAQFDLSVRRTGCVWPLWLFSNAAYDAWTLKPTPSGTPPNWLRVDGASLTFVELPDGKRRADVTAEVVCRCFNGGGVLLAYFEASYDGIMGAVAGPPPAAAQQELPGRGDDLPASQEMLERPLVPAAAVSIGGGAAAASQPLNMSPAAYDPAPLPAAQPAASAPIYQQPAPPPPAPPAPAPVEVSGGDDWL